MTEYYIMGADGLAQYIGPPPMTTQEFAQLVVAVESGTATTAQQEALWEELISQACGDLACGAGFCVEYPDRAIEILQRGRNFWDEARRAFAQIHELS